MVAKGDRIAANLRIVNLYVCGQHSGGCIAGPNPMSPRRGLGRSVSASDQAPRATTTTTQAHKRSDPRRRARRRHVEVRCTAAAGRRCGFRPCAWGLGESPTPNQLATSPPSAVTLILYKPNETESDRSTAARTASFLRRLIALLLCSVRWLRAPPVRMRRERTPPTRPPPRSRSPSSGGRRRLAWRSSASGPGPSEYDGTINVVTVTAHGKHVTSPAVVVGAHVAGGAALRGGTRCATARGRRATS